MHVSLAQTAIIQSEVVALITELNNHTWIVDLLCVQRASITMFV